MICKNCSFDNSEDMNFCQNCGASLADAKAEKINSAEEENIATEENNVPQTENTTSIKELEGFKDGKGFKFYLFRIIIPVIALFLIVFIGITTLKPDKYSIIKNQIIYNYNDEGDYTEIYLILQNWIIKLIAHLVLLVPALMVIYQSEKIMMMSFITLIKRD